MPGFCLLPKQIDAFLSKIKAGELNPDELIAMGSAGRHAAFAEIVGEVNARSVNALFESKLLLKHQQEGIISWAQKVGGLKPEVQRDMLARVGRMERVLEPKELDAFLADLAEQKLGFGVTMEEAGRIAELAKATADAKALPRLPNGNRPIEYGEARVRFGDYVSDLKNASRKPTVWGGVKSTAGLMKSLVSTLDNSIIGRQGLNTAFTNPDVWAKNSLQTFVDMHKSFKGEEVTKAVDAELFSRANAELYQRGKLALGNIEEQFPSSIPEKIPGFGRIYKANEAAFQNWQRRTRADVFDKYVEIAKKMDADLTTKQLEEFGAIANSLTGRGSLGKAEVFADQMNLFLFSGRKIAADLDVLTGHQIRNLSSRAGGGEGMSKTSQLIAADNLAKIIAGTAAMMIIANAVKPGSAEPDLTSAGFGTVEKKTEDDADVVLALLADMLGFGSNTYGGKTHIDITGGKRGIITLAARLAARSTKSSTTGRVTRLYAGGFSEKVASTLVTDFAANKRSPAVTALWELYTQQGRDHKPLTAASFVKENAPVPASITTAAELIAEKNKHKR